MLVQMLVTSGNRREGLSNTSFDLLALFLHRPGGPLDQKIVSRAVEKHRTVPLRHNVSVRIDELEVGLSSASRSIVHALQGRKCVLGASIVRRSWYASVAWCRW